MLISSFSGLRLVATVAQCAVVKASKRAILIRILTHRQNRLKMFDESHCRDPDARVRIFNISLD